MVLLTVTAAAALADGQAAPVGAALRPDPPLLAQKLICFPPHRFPDIQEICGDACVLWTDVPLEAARSRERLDAAMAVLRALPLQPLPLPLPVPLAPEPTAYAAWTARLAATPAPQPRPIGLALYAAQGPYRDLWYRVGVYYGGRIVGADDAGGYSYRVFCASYADDAAPGALPAELYHELTHVWLWQHIGLPNDGNWLAEGLAACVQERLAPDPTAPADAAERVRTGRFLPLPRLLAQQPVPPDRYWQVRALAETLLAEYPDRLPAVVRAVREGRSAHAIVTDTLGTDWLTLERQWRQAVAAAATEPAAP